MKWCRTDWLNRRRIVTCSKYNYSSQISFLNFMIRISFPYVFRYKLCDDRDKFEMILRRSISVDSSKLMMLPSRFQASNDNYGAMAVAIIELQIPRWSTGCAASHTKSACFRSMAADNNRDGLPAIEISRTIQTNRRPGILKGQKRSPCVVTYGCATPRNNVHLIRIHTLDAVREVEDSMIGKDRERVTQSCTPTSRNNFA